MRINWDIKNPVVRKRRRWFVRRPVPMHMSSHYVREHFVDEPQGKLF